MTDVAKDVVPANLWRQVQLFRDFVPERVTLAWPRAPMSITPLSGWALVK